jgi:hypothetical protein
MKHIVAVLTLIWALQLSAQQEPLSLTLNEAIAFALEN